MIINASLVSNTLSQSKKKKKKFCNMHLVKDLYNVLLNGVTRPGRGLSMAGSPKWFPAFWTFMANSFTYIIFTALTVFSILQQKKQQLVKCLGKKPP